MTHADLTPDLYNFKVWKSFYIGSDFFQFRLLFLCLSELKACISFVSLFPPPPSLPPQTWWLMNFGGKFWFHWGIRHLVDQGACLLSPSPEQRHIQLESLWMSCLVYFSSCAGVFQTPTIVACFYKITVSRVIGTAAEFICLVKVITINLWSRSVDLTLCSCVLGLF